MTAKQQKALDAAIETEGFNKGNRDAHQVVRVAEVKAGEFFGDSYDEAVLEVKKAIDWQNDVTGVANA